MTWTASDTAASISLLSSLVKRPSTQLLMGYCATTGSRWATHQSPSMPASHLVPNRVAEAPLFQHLTRVHLPVILGHIRLK